MECQIEEQPQKDQLQRHQGMKIKVMIVTQPLPRNDTQLM